MDTSIRKLLVKAEKFSASDKNPALQQAYNLLRSVGETRPAADTPESFGQDLFVLCAEFAYQHGNTDIARECLKMFFMKQPPANQFLCRAFLCQAQLLAPENANNLEQLEKAVVYILKAISFTKDIQRYHFLVYNASVIYWKICQQFLRPKYRQHLAQSLHQVVKALEETDDSDYEWRAQLMLALIECYLDAHYQTDALKVASAAAPFIKTKVPHLYKTVFALMIRYNLADETKLLQISQSSPELTVFYKICKLKNELDPPDLHQAEKMASTPELFIESDSHPGTKPNVSQNLSESDQSDVKDVNGDASDFKGKKETEDFSSDIQSILAQMGVLLKQDSLHQVSSKNSRKMSYEDQLDLDKTERPLLLLEICRLCLELNLHDLALVCVEAMRKCDVKEPGFYQELEFVECEMMINSLGGKQETYQKSVVDIRLQAIKRCEEAVMNAIRQSDPKVIQVGCMTLWNLCLPLLQPNLRHLVQKSLILIADALENIGSLLNQLRCEVYMELARCYEDKEQVQVAMDNLEKALLLDIENVYQEKLEVLLHRLKLRAQLYKQPERPEDQAAMIIEQTRKTSDLGNFGMKRSLLVKAGEMLAPDAFLLVLDSENDAKDHSSGNRSHASTLAGRAQHFNNCVIKAEGHLRRLGDTNAKERARLWADLAKTARKQEVWDVCRVACRFCLLYDGGRKKSSQQRSSESLKTFKSKSDYFKHDEKMTSVSGNEPSSTLTVLLNDRDLNRMMAEIAFINGEALVQLLRSENVQLNDKPVYPEDRRNQHKSHVTIIEDDSDWLHYCNWIKDLSEEATYNFLRGMALGIELEEHWIVFNAATYIWNYNNHILSQGRHSEIVPHLTAVLEGFQKQGCAGESYMLVNICNTLAKGVIKPWISDTKALVKPDKDILSPKIQKGKKIKGQTLVQEKSKTSLMSVTTDAMTDLKKAIHFCEFAMQLSATNDPKNVVPIFQLLPILQTWVQAKQLAQQQIPKQLGKDGELLLTVQCGSEDQHQMIGAVVALEMLFLNKNELMEYKDAPTIEEVVQMVASTKWTDKFVELQIWTRLAYLAFETHLHALVMQCSKNALRFAAFGTQPRNRKMDLHNYSVEQDMLSYASVFRGQSLVENMKGKDSLLREALECFLSGAKYARSSGNYELVMTAARHYWNAIIPLVGQSFERDILREPLKIILECIAAVAGKTLKEEKPVTEVKIEAKDDSEEHSEVLKDKKDSKIDKEPKSVEKKMEDVKVTTEITDKLVDDLTLRAAMYGVLFQCYADKGKWKEALEAIDNAIAEMPRTKHRLLIFKHRVMVKAKLGQPVHMFIQKFKDESEDVLAHMWHRMALSSKEAMEQLSSYQCSIEALENETNGYQKVENLLEFGQWMYSNHFSLEDVQDQLGWAINILLNMKAEGSHVTKHYDGKKGRGIGIKQQTSSEPLKLSSAGSINKVGKKISDKGRKKLRHKGSQKSESMVLKRTKYSTKAISSETSQTKSTYSEDSDLSYEINAKDYIPVLKMAEIGVLPVNMDLTVNDLVEVRQLDALIRSHILWAEISGTESDQFRDTLLMAYQLLMRLWNVLISSCASSIREMVKIESASVKDDTVSRNPKTPMTGKKEEKDKKKEEKPKLKRKYPADAIPSDVETWAVYDWPDEGLEVFKKESLKTVAITQDNIPKPMLTFYYLERLITQLREIGYNHLALPVLAFQDLLTRSLIKSNALYKLVHLRSVEVCQELNIKSAVSHHLKIIGSMCLNVEDQAKSHIEISQWQERLNRAAREEQRVKETVNVNTESTKPMLPNKKSIQKQTQESKTASTENESHLGKVLSDVVLRDVWTDTAEVLIRQGMYQRAREYLNEANIAAEAFDDLMLQARIMLLFARLAYYEGQYGLAINLCQKAQMLKYGDEKFWFETCILHFKAIIKEGKKDCLKKAAKLLEDAVREFSKSGDEHPNRKNVIKFYCAKLEAKLVKIHFRNILHSNKDMKSQQVFDTIITGSEYYEHISEQLMKLNCYQDVIHIAKKHGRILKMLVKESADRQLRWMYYFQMLNVLRQAALLAEQVYVEVLTLFSIYEMKCLSTPIQREFADMNIELGEILTDVLICQEKERRHIQLQEERKASIIHLVQEYIWEPPVYKEKEKQWIELGRIAADEAISFFTCAHSLSDGIPHLRAKCLAGLGRLLRVVSEHHGPDPPSMWMVYDIETLRIQLEEEVAETKKVAEQEKNAESLENASEHVNDALLQEDKQEEPTPLVVDAEKAMKRKMRYTKQMIVKQNQHETSKFYCMCASECLSQCLNISLQNSFTDLVAIASYEMVTLIGQHDSSAASLILSLYQSCQSSLTMEQVLFKSQPDPLTSQLAALLHQRYHLMKKDLRTNLTTSQFFKDLMTTLSNDWQAWKKLYITSNYLELLKEMPSNYILIVLQHSPDKNFLYGAVLDKSKATTALEKSKIADRNTSRARVFREPSDFNQFKQILSRLHEYKQRQQSMLLKKENWHLKAMLREKMHENLDLEFKTATMESQCQLDSEDIQLEKEFLEIVEAMNVFLKPVLEPICSSLRDDKSISNLTTEGREKEKISNVQFSKNECAVLLAEPDLMQMPLETSFYLQQLDQINSISRDFSLQLLYSRTHNATNSEQRKGEGKKKAAVKETSKAFSRILDLTDAKRRQSKIIPLERSLYGWQISVNTHNFRYIVNPFLDCAETETNDPVKEFEMMIEKYRPQFTMRWLGVSGSEHTPSVGEWEIYLTESSAFIFYGMERLLSYIPPHKMSALNIPDCNILFSFDLAETSKCFQRQSKLDAQKSPADLSLESPVEMAMLASLSGIRCIFLNQWHCSLAENADRMHQTMEFLLSKGKTTGQTCYMIQNPKKAYMEEKLAENMAAKNKHPPKDKKKSKDEDEVPKDSQNNKDKGLHEVRNVGSFTEGLTKQEDDLESKLENMPAVSRSIFNMICYGMPNLVVTQEPLSLQPDTGKAAKKA